MLITVLFMPKIWKFMLGIVAVVMLTAILYYSVRPTLVEKQTNQAIEELEGYLINKYPGESWNITDSDDFELKDRKILYVIFDNEISIVYGYAIEDEDIDQIKVFEKETGKDSLEGLSLKHRE